MGQGAVRPGDEAYGGQAPYTPLLLTAYDLFNLRFSARFVFRCPAERMIRHYDEHVSSPHLDIGVVRASFSTSAASRPRRRASR